jgi:histone H3/H4
MNDKILKNELDALQRSIDRVDNKIEPKFDIKPEVQHSLIWATALVIVAVILYWIVKALHWKKKNVGAWLKMVEQDKKNELKRGLEWNTLATALVIVALFLFLLGMRIGYSWAYGNGVFAGIQRADLEIRQEIVKCEADYQGMLRAIFNNGQLSFDCLTQEPPKVPASWTMTAKKQHVFPYSSIKRVLKSNEAKLITREALEEFELVLRDIANDLAKRSVELCKFRKSTMVRKEDVRQATK